MKINDKQSLYRGSVVTQQIALEMVGDSHTYQWRVLLILCLCLCVSSFHVTGQSYTFIDPPLLCDGKPCPNSDFCKNYDDITVDRSDGYKYKNLVTQFELWCSKKKLGTIAQSTYFLGNILGGSIMSQMGDRIGRRKTYIISWGMLAVGSIAMLFSLSIYQYMAANFFMGFGGMPCYILNYVIINEMSGTSFRQKSSVMTLVAWSFSEVLTGIMYYLIPDWEYCFATFVTVPAGVLFFTTFYIRETPSYYAQKRQVSDLYKSLDDIAKINKKPAFSLVLPSITEVLDENMRLSSPDRQSLLPKLRKYNLTDLFRFKSLRNASIGFTFISFTLHLIFYGGQYSISDISTGDNIYVLGVVMGVTEFITYLFVKQIIHLLKRRRTLIITYILQIGFCASFLIFGWTADSTKTNCTLCSKSIGIIVIACLVRVFNSIGFAFQGLYSNEVYPTCVRALGSGFLFSVGVFGSFLSPYVIAFADFLELNPYLLIGVFSTSGPFATLLVRETLGQPLTDNISEEEYEIRESQKTYL